MRQTLTNDFWGLHKNIYWAFPLRSAYKASAFSEINPVPPYLFPPKILTIKNEAKKINKNKNSLFCSIFVIFLIFRPEELRK